jgi:hypothetical protein
MRTKIIEQEIYSLDDVKNNNELLKKVLEKNYEINLYYDWWDCVYYDRKEKIGEVGFSINNIYFSGFWSQGDGAMFEYDRIDDKLLNEFVDTLDLSPMRKQWIINNIYISGKGHHRGHYNHEKCCSHSIYWEVANGGLHWSTNFYKWLESFADDFEEFIVDKYEDLCRDLYRSLEKEYDYLTSEGAILESLESNEYEFDINGNITI